MFRSSGALKNYVDTILDFFDPLPPGGYFYLIGLTRKYLLRGYFLGVLTHTTAWDRLWGGDETLTMWF